METRNKRKMRELANVYDSMPEDLKSAFVTLRERRAVSMRFASRLLDIGILDIIVWIVLLAIGVLKNVSLSFLPPLLFFVFYIVTLLVIRKANTTAQDAWKSVLYAHNSVDDVEYPLSRYSNFENMREGLVYREREDKK